MKLFGFEIARTATIDARVDERAAQVLDRYANNTDALRCAVASHFGLSDAHYIRSDSMLIVPMTRAIKAFAAEVMRQRAGIKLPPAVLSETRKPRRSPAGLKRWPA